MKATALILPCFAVASSFCLSGCASSVSSQWVKPGSAAPDGILYHLPKRSIKVSITIKGTDGKATADTISVSNGDPYADLSSTYVLEYEQSYLGKNHAKLDVTEQGLLSSAGSDSTSGISDIAKSLATLAGELSAMSALKNAPQPPAPPKCTPGQTYVLVIDPGVTPASNTMCDYSIAYALQTAINIHPSARANSGSKESGFFYRQALPYSVTITDAKKNEIGVYRVSSPDQAPVSFLPVSRSLFANNTASATFSSGMLTEQEESVDGELVAIAKLPADVIGAYFDAVGNMFTKKQTNLSDQKNFIDAQNQLALERLKRQSCTDAVAAKDPDQIKAACSDK